MRFLMLIWLTLVQLVQQAWLFPRSLTMWRQRTALNEAEAERLDRIRNPSKYRGRG
jgi:hypothetical protein